MTYRPASLAGPCSGLAAQGALLLRAVTLLDAPATLAKPDRVMGNSLRELDLFLTDMIAEAVWIAQAGARPFRRIPDRRIYSAAEAWRRAALCPQDYIALKRVRAAQNRLAFAPPVAGAPPTYPDLGEACALYARLARQLVDDYLPRTRALRAA